MGQINSVTPDLVQRDVKHCSFIVSVNNLLQVKNCSTLERPVPQLLDFYRLDITVHNDLSITRSFYLTISAMTTWTCTY